MESSDARYRGGNAHSAASAASAATTPMRPGTPESRNTNPFGDEISPAPRADSFASPFTSRPASSGTRGPSSRYFHSRRVRKGEVEKPWLDKKDPKEKWVTIIPLIGLLVGCGIAGFLIYDGLSSVVQHQYCSVLSDDFSGGTLNTDIWTMEAEVGGFGNGEFGQSTTDGKNVYIENGKLIIKPTLQDEALIEQNSVVNLTADGTCTYDDPNGTLESKLKACAAVTNLTTGVIVPPVRTGRINTKKGAKITYGRVEVTAKLPVGDWLWPAIWMLPVSNTYGPWPLSGEIDIVESRGNNHTYKQGGNNIVSSALHWGPDHANDAWWRTNVKRSALHTTYAATEHTFGLEWSEKYLFTYVNTRLLQVLYTNFNRPLWQRGKFPLSDSNGTRLVDAWSKTGRDQTPFDQEFYLILNVAVGGTNGWFEDGKSGKPWIDSSPTAARDFWSQREDWLPTWQKKGAGQMEISKVQIWQQGACK